MDGLEMVRKVTKTIFMKERKHLKTVRYVSIHGDILN